MKKVLRRIDSNIRQFGFDPIRTIHAIIFFPKFIRDLILVSLKSDIRIKSFYPQLNDWNETSGVAAGHYFHQDIIVARWILEENPVKHVDVASRVDGFVAHLAVFREVEVYDIRPMKTSEKNIRFRQVNFMNEGVHAATGKSFSISCLHSLEHFGLGRYSDPIDVDGHLKGFNNLISLLEKGGNLYFSVPLGDLRIEFNAHRVFSMRYIKEYFIDEHDLIVKDFAYIDDRGDAHVNVSFEEGLDNNFECDYGVAIFKVGNE